MTAATPDLSGYCPDCGNYGRIHGRVQDVHDGPMRDCLYKGFDMRKWSQESINAMLRQEARA